MVQQMIEKFNEYRLVNSGTVMATGDEQQPISAKKPAPGDLPNEAVNTVPIASGNSPPIKDRVDVSDSTRVSGVKRHQTSYPLSPARSQPSNPGGTNGHLVYVRRKIETESSKTDSSHSAVMKKSSSSCTSDPKSQPESVSEVTASPLLLFTTLSSASLNALSGGPTPAYPPGKPITGLPVPAPNYSTVPTAIPIQPETKRVPTGASVQSEPQRVPSGVPIQPEPHRGLTKVPVQPETQRQRNQNWEERFLRLQLYLKNCDEASQEEYIQKLRCLSAVGRSKHAYELEKKALQLLLEEGKELHRMRVLNVLGKALPDGNPPVSTQIHSVE